MAGYIIMGGVLLLTCAELLKGLVRGRWGISAIWGVWAAIVVLIMMQGGCATPTAPPAACLDCEQGERPQWWESDQALLYEKCEPWCVTTGRMAARARIEIGTDGTTRLRCGCAGDPVELWIPTGNDGTVPDPQPEPTLAGGVPGLP